MKQPEPPNVEIPFNGLGQALYSHMEEFPLRRLRKYIDELITWKAAGKPITLGTITYAIITDEKP